MFFKMFFSILMFLFIFSALSQPNEKKELDLDSPVLKIRDRFPGYRVHYDPVKIAEKVQEEFKKSDENTSSKKSAQ